MARRTPKSLRPKSVKVAAHERQQQKATRRQRIAAKSARNVRVSA